MEFSPLFLANTGGAPFNVRSLFFFLLVSQAIDLFPHFFVEHIFLRATLYP